jgi:hypothetical protein
MSRELFISLKVICDPILINFRGLVSSYNTTCIVDSDVSVTQVLILEFYKVPHPPQHNVRNMHNLMVHVVHCTGEKNLPQCKH